MVLSIMKKMDRDTMQYMLSYDEKDEVELPSEKGWYPACQCWDPREGAFPSAVYFDGEK